MPNYYYVDNDGVATGDAGRSTTKLTGSFTALGTASAYVSITAALAATTPPAAGDFIVCSEFYVFDNVSSIISRTFPQTGQGVTCISVDDTAIDSYKKGAKEETNSTIRSTGKVAFIGFTHDTSDAIESGTNSHVTYKDSTLVLSTSNDNIEATLDGSSMDLIGCDVQCAFSSCGFIAKGGGKISMFGGSVTATTSVTDLIKSSTSAAGGATLIFNGVDLSSVTGSLSNAGGAQTFDDLIRIEIDQCKLASGVGFNGTPVTNLNHTIKVSRSSFTSSSAEYQSFYGAYNGDVEDDSAIFRNEDEPFTESNQKISYKITTNANSSIGLPFIFDFPVLRYSRLSDVATDNLRFYLTSNTALTNNDIWLEIIYPDGSNKQTPNFVTSQNADFFAAGTTLTTDGTSTYTGGLSNKYQIDVPTSGDVGADCQPIIRVYCSIQNTVIYLASEFGLN